MRLQEDISNVPHNCVPLLLARHDFATGQDELNTVLGLLTNCLLQQVLGTRTLNSLVLAIFSILEKIQATGSGDDQY